MSGDWAETGRPESTSSVITISQPPPNPGDRSADRKTETTFTREIMEFEPDESDVDIRTDDNESELSDADKDRARKESLDKLQSSNSPTVSTFSEAALPKPLDMPKRSVTKIRRRTARANRPDAVIVLKEEKVRNVLASR